MAKSSAVVQDLLQYTIGDASAFGSAAARYVRLWTVLPALDGTGGTEVTGGSYAAVEVHTSSKFPAVGASDTEVANDVAVTFPTSTAAWGTVVGYTISAASTGTDFLRIVSISSTVVAISTTPTFAIGSIVLRET